MYAGYMSRNEKLEKFLLYSTTGVFPYSPRDELNGPFDDVKTKPMENVLGIEPKENPYIQDSKMCGTCHAINLPNVDAPTDTPLQGLDPEDQKIVIGLGVAGILDRCDLRGVRRRRDRHCRSGPRGLP